MEVDRTSYLKKLIAKKDNGRLKIITGIRRSGKSYLLFELYRKYLLATGVSSNQIVLLALDELSNAKYRNPFELDSYLKSQIKGKEKTYLFIDEIQYVEDIQNPYVDNPKARITFVDVVLGLMKIPNVDIYITGSNSRMLSSDILTQFRDRGDEIRVFPLSYAEFSSAYEGDKRFAWSEYLTYGGMPLVMTLPTHEEKSDYLKKLFTKTYMKDVVERHQIRSDVAILGDLLNVLSSSVGFLTNPAKLSRTFASLKQASVSPATITMYLSYFLDAFLIDKAERYDIKGKKYIDSPFKYYFTDIGLRNARLNFRQVEESHIMENVIFTELKRRCFDVDVGSVVRNSKDKDGKSVRSRLEVDFVVNRGSQRYYMQSVLHVDTFEKRMQETESLKRTGDSFRKLVIVKDPIVPWHDDDGILYVGIEQFLLDEHALDL